MQSLEESFTNICSKNDISNLLDELYRNISAHYERIKVASESDIEKIMFSYSQTSEESIIKLNDFLNYQLHNEKSVSLLDKYAELSSFLLKIQSLIFRSHRNICELEDEVFKIEYEIIQGLKNYEKIEKIDDKQKEIKSFYDLGKKKIILNKKCFIQETLTEMQNARQLVQSFYLIWKKIMKDNISTSHNHMYYNSING